MKTYYWVKLYQVTKDKSYIYNEKLKIEIEDVKDSLINSTIKSSFLEEKGIIMVEKIFPYQVREVKTGITFPIININMLLTNGRYCYFIEPILKKEHTFVFSKEYSLISKQVVTSEELELYNSTHSDIKLFKDELLTIFNEGKNTMINKIETRKAEKLMEKNIRLMEKKKVRKLQRQFEQERKNI